MGGVCERPGCARSAAAAVAIDPRRSTVWIGDLDTSGPRVNVLCAQHADDLVVPVGWERRDIRDTPRLFMVPSSPSAPARPRRMGRRTRTAPSPTAVVAQALDAAAEPVTAPHPATTDAVATGQTGAGQDPGPNPTLAALHRRSTELSAATVALLDVNADSPLLARAFRAGCATG